MDGKDGGKEENQGGGREVGEKKEGEGERESKEDTWLCIKPKNVELIGNTAPENQEQQGVQHACLAKDQTSS